MSVRPLLHSTCGEIQPPHTTKQSHPLPDTSSHQPNNSTPPPTPPQQESPTRGTKPRANFGDQIGCILRRSPHLQRSGQATWFGLNDNVSRLEIHVTPITVCTQLKKQSLTKSVLFHLETGSRSRPGNDQFQFRRGRTPEVENVMICHRRRYSVRFIP